MPTATNPAHTVLFVIVRVAYQRTVFDVVGSGFPGLSAVEGSRTYMITVHRETKMIQIGFETRRAHPADAQAILLAHLDSIRSIGPTFYPSEIVEEWGAGLTPDVYAEAMAGGEAFFIATGQIDDRPAVLGFATHRVDDAEDGVSVYVRGSVARRGIGTALLRLAEAHAREHGATSIHIQASLAGVGFYRANGFEERGRGEAVLMTGRSMPCVFMRKRLIPR